RGWPPCRRFCRGNHRAASIFWGELEAAIPERLYAKLGVPRLRATAGRADCIGRGAQRQIRGDPSNLGNGGTKAGSLIVYRAVSGGGASEGHCPSSDYRGESKIAVSSCAGFPQGQPGRVHSAT